MNRVGAEQLFVCGNEWERSKCEHCRAVCDVCIVSELARSLAMG